MVPLIWICPVMTSSPTSFANEEPLQGCRSFKRAQPKHESELLVFKSSVEGISLGQYSCAKVIDST